MYSEPHVAAFITREFVPVRVHVRDQADEYKRLSAKYQALWTPTILVLDDTGQERHRIEGFLPSEPFLAQLAIGLAHSAFKRGRFADAERLFMEVVERHPETDAAPEAVYWAGVSRYKATGDASALAATAAAFEDRYQGSVWATKASVWRH